MDFLHLFDICSENYWKNHTYFKMLTPVPFVRPSVGHLVRRKSKTTDGIKTFFLDRWQWEEGQCTIIIILLCILTELSPLNHLFFIMDACLGHILESTNAIIGLKWNLVYRYICQYVNDRYHNPTLYIYIELSPLNYFFIMVACSCHILESTKRIEIKLGTYIAFNERKCSRQES